MAVKIVTIIGARPQIIKAAALSRAIREKFSDRIEEIIVHTGQHYDRNMSQVFIDELGIPQPDHNLNVGSASHGVQTARMIEGIEKILLDTNPDFLILYGDTNSTLAGAVAASKLHVPVVHIEAGLRSFNKSMPEEINRIVCDHASTLLFSPTKTGFNNLVREGFNPANKAPFNIDHPGIFHCGDVMYDNSLYFSEIAEKRSEVLAKYDLKNEKFLLGTIHRDNNTDDPDRLKAIFKGLLKIAKEDEIDILLPLHPRTSKKMAENLTDSLNERISKNEHIKIIEPASFLDMIALEKNAKLILTDSGGVQKESYFFQKPCIIMRPETEWVEIVENKTAIIADADEEKIFEAWKSLRTPKGMVFPPVFGDGHAAEFICNEILNASKS